MLENIKKCDIVIHPENGDDQDNIKKVRPIVRQIKFSREDLRKKFSFEKKIIVISDGGTDTGIFLIKKALESISVRLCDRGCCAAKTFGNPKIVSAKKHI